MAQKFYNDKILGLSQSSGIITLGAGSVLTIGGQQYTLSANITLTVPTLITTTLYMLYAVVANGVVSLVQSTNVNSVGPAGQSAWKLVGAYYSNGVVGSIAFGSFVTIEGPPTSQPIFYTATASGFTSTTQWDGYWMRIGRQMMLECRVSISGNLASEMRFPLPPGYTTATAYTQLHNVGQMTFGTAGVAAGVMLANTGNLAYLTAGWQSSAFGGTNSRLGNDTAATVFSYTAHVNVNELSNIPLRDL